MRVKTFQGRTLEEVLPEIRRELGPGAVVLGHRPIVEGGVGGFFGKRIVEVTAADSMPSDEELVALEDRVMGREADAGAEEENSGSLTRGRDAIMSAAKAFMTNPAAADDAVSEPVAAAPSTINMVDDWDPSEDDELAEEYGTVLRDLAAARRDVRDATPAGADAAHDAGATNVRALAEAAFEQAQLPARQPTVSPMNPMASAAYGRTNAESDVPERRAPAPRDTFRVGRNVEESEPQGADIQARQLAVRAHEAIAAATAEIEQQLSSARFQQATGTTGGGTTTLRANVIPSTPSIRPGFTHDAIDSAVEEEIIDDPAVHAFLGEKPAIVHPVAPVECVVNERVLQAAAHMQSYLLSTGVDLDVAEALMHSIVQHRVPFVADADMRDMTRDTIAETISVSTGWASIGRCHRIAVVGASGAGKSSVVAKLAEGYAGSGLRVGVVSIIAGATSSSQIAAHANDPLIRRGTMEVQFAADAEQMIAALQRFDGRDVVLIDTPSSAYLDAASYAAVSRCLAAVRIDDVQVALPLSTSVREAESVVEHFRPMGVKHLIVTKLDESRYAGQLLNYGFRFGLPMTFLTDGQRVPEDIRAASAAEIAALIIPHQHEGDSAQ